MSEEEWQAEVVALRAEIEQLRALVEDLEQHAGRHDCLFDLCEYDAERSRCRLAPCDHDEVDE